MKKILLIIGLFITNLLATAQQNVISIDPTFNTGSGFNGTVNTVVLQPDGKVLVGGSFTQYNGVTANKIVRLNSDGSIDSSFNIGGTGFNGTNVSAIALNNAGGRIYIGGNFTSYNGILANRIVCLNTNGGIVSSFNSGVGFNEEVKSMIWDSGLYVGGKFTSYNGTAANRIIRLYGNGSVEPIFSNGTGTGFDSDVNVILKNINGLYIGGKFSSYNGYSSRYLIRISASEGVVMTAMPYAFFYYPQRQINTAFIQSDGNVITGGFYTRSDISPLYANSIDRFSALLNLDNTFSTNLIFDGGEIFSIKQLQDGKLLIGGAFVIPFSGGNGNNIIRLNTDGSIDNSFSSGPGTNGYIYSMDVQSDGKIIIGGTFTNINGTIANRIVRIYPEPLSSVVDNPNGCLATYPFNGNTNDESGNNYNATNNGAILTMDRNGNSNKAYNFNGTSNYIQFPSAIGTSLTTVSMWFKPTSSQDNQIVLRNRMYGYEVAYNKVYDGTDRANKLSTKLYINNSSGSYNEYTYIHPTNLNLNQWYHIAFTYDGNYYRVYLDNTMVYQSNSFGTGTVKYENSGAGYVIGRDGDTPYWYFKGSIDDLSVWGRALSGSELNTIYTGETLNTIDYESNKKFILYPNPAKDLLHIKIPENINIINCELFDISGKMIKGQIFNNSIDVSQIQKGMYLIRLETGEGSFTEKFIKE